MKKTFSTWSAILTSPSKGFSAFDNSTPFSLALILILLLVLASTAMLIPIISSDAYADAVIRVQITTLQERGTEMSAEQIEAMKQAMSSGSARTITMLSSTIGGVAGYTIMMIVSVLLFKLILLVFKEKAKFKLLFSIMVYIGIISIVQMLIKNGITLFTDYERVLSRVQNTSDIQHALTSAVSAAALFSPAKMNSSVYYLIDAVTDIFNWIYYAYLYAAVRWTLKLEHKKALAVTIVSALIFILFGLIFTFIF